MQCKQSVAFMICVLAFFVMGLETHAAPLNWTQVSPAAGWAGREEARVEMFNGKLYLMGGYVGPGPADVTNDVWSSLDGIAWTQVTASAPWPARYGHASAVFGGKLWVMGGMAGTDWTMQKFNDVWFTSDGVNWTQASNAGWSPRASLRCQVYDNKLWVIGGYTGGFANDAWYTSDGQSWTRATASAPWSGRCAVGLADFGGKLWLFGGGVGSSVESDIWWTTDGANWTQATPGGIIWPARQHHCVVNFDNKLWIIGGWYWTTTAAFRQDVWYSSDGVNWTQDTAAAPWPARSSHQAQVVNGRIMLWGGRASTGRLSDVWMAPSIPVPVELSGFSVE